MTSRLGGAEQRLADGTGGEALDWSPDGSRLVWAERSGPDQPFRIVGLAIDGLARQEITEPPPGSLGDLGPELSPDGRSLVFSSNRGGLFSLWQVDVEGGEPRWLGASGDDLDAPSVGPGGRLVAYEQWNDDTNLYAFPLDGSGEPRRLEGSTPWDWGPHVAASGDEIVFVSDRSGSSELWTRTLDGAATAHRLTEFGGPYVNHPRWSPDGQRVAFDARPGGNADIYLLNASEAEPRRLTDHPAQDVAPTWSRDGGRLYFASDRSGAWELWSVAPGGGEPEQVTEDSGYFGQESADGRWLYFSRRHESGIWRRPLAGRGGPELVVPDLAPISRSHWLVTDDGAVLYLRRPHYGRAVLVRRDLASGRVDEFGELGAVSYNSGLALTGDGASVLFTRYDRRESDILVLQLAH